MHRKQPTGCLLPFEVFNFFITFESYCTVKSAKVKFKRKTKKASILGDAKNQKVHLCTSISKTDSD